MNISFENWKRDVEVGWKLRGKNIKIISRALRNTFIILLVICFFIFAILVLTNDLNKNEIERLQKENVQWCNDYNLMANLTEIMIRDYINSSFAYSTPYSNCKELEGVYNGNKRN